MRLQIVPLLQRTAGQAVGSAHNAAGAELQGAFRSLLAATAPSNRSLSAAVSAEGGEAEQQQAVAADASAPSDQHAAADASSSSSPTITATADQPSSSSSHSHSSKGRNSNRQPSKRGPTNPDTQQFLKDVGLFVDPSMYRRLGPHLQDRLAGLRHLTPALLHQPSAFMAAACVNGLQLQTVVSPTADATAELHPLEFAEEWVQQQRSKQQQQRLEQKQKQEAKQAAGGVSSSNGGSKGSAADAAAAAKQQKQQQQAQQGQGAAAAASNRQKAGSSSSSVGSGGYLSPHQRQQQQVASEALARLQTRSKSPLWKVQLLPANLVSENSSDLMVNLNVQMTNARAAGPDTFPDHKATVNLFDQLLDQGIKAALEQQQQQQKGQLQEGAEGQQGVPLLLPEQYRPDHTAFVSYCKSVARLSETTGSRIHQLQRPPKQQRPQGVDRWGERTAPVSEALRRLQLQGQQEQARLLAQGIGRVAQLWQPSSDSLKGAGKMGMQLHIAQMAALRAAGRQREALDYWEGVRPRLQPELLAGYWRLHYYATACALEAQDLEAADRYALVFSDKVNGTGFRRADYVAAIGPLVSELVDALARAHMWDQAVYWLQQLINHDPLRPVEPRSFLVMLQEAASGGRMDLARVMLSALDDTLKIQGQPPYVYSEWQCMHLIAGASRSGDVPFIELVWDRLSQDVQRDARSNTDRHQGRLSVSSDVVQEISGGSSSGGVTTATRGDDPAAAAATDGSSSSSEGADGGRDRAASKGAAAAVTKHPSKDAYAAAVKAFVGCEAYGKAFEFLHSMGGLFGGEEPVCSVYQGVRCFPEALDTEAKIAAAFSQLKARKDAGQPITTTMLNVLTRAIARSSDTTTVGKVFNAYEPTWGLQPDVDTYNAVLEACEAAGKVGAVQGMLSLMASRGVAPNTVSWNLLLSTCVRAGDSKAVVSALNRMREAGIDPSTKVLDDAVTLSYDQSDPKLRAVIRQVASAQLPANHPLNRRLGAAAGTWGSSGGGGGVGRQGGAAGAPGGVDVWKPRGSSSSRWYGSRRGSVEGDGEEQRQRAASA